MNEYGYEVELVDQISTNMHGSGEVHTCYFYKRLSRPPASMVPIPGCSIVTLPPRPGTDDKPVDIFTADLFKEAVVQAAGVCAYINLHFNFSLYLMPLYSNIES